MTTECSTPSGIMESVTARMQLFTPAGFPAGVFKLATPDVLFDRAVLADTTPEPAPNTADKQVCASIHGYPHLSKSCNTKDPIGFRAIQLLRVQTPRGA